jgi:hypothetical protein
VQHWFALDDSRPLFAFSSFRALFLRLKARRGPKKHHDLGPDYFQRTERTRLAARLARRLNELGFEVTLAERAAALGRQRGRGDASGRALRSREHDALHRA